jgi:hypothetical protein
MDSTGYEVLVPAAPSLVRASKTRLPEMLSRPDDHWTVDGHVSLGIARHCARSQYAVFEPTALRKGAAVLPPLLPAAAPAPPQVM